MLEEQQEMREGKLEGLRKAVGEGFEELDRGEGVPGDQVFEEILAGLERHRAMKT